jgi:transposase
MYSLGIMYTIHLHFTIHGAACFFIVLHDNKHFQQTLPLVAFHPVASLLYTSPYSPEENVFPKFELYLKYAYMYLKYTIDYIGKTT